MKKQVMLLLMGLSMCSDMRSMAALRPALKGMMPLAIAGLLYYVRNLRFEIKHQGEEMEIILTALLLKSADEVRSAQNGGDRVITMPGSDARMTVPEQNWQRAQLLARSVAAKAHNSKDPTGRQELPVATSRLEKLLEQYQAKNPTKYDKKDKDKSLVPIKRF